MSLQLNVIIAPAAVLRSHNRIAACHVSLLLFDYPPRSISVSMVVTLCRQHCMWSVRCTDCPLTAGNFQCTLLLLLLLMCVPHQTMSQLLGCSSWS